MNGLLDTSIIVDLLRNNKTAEQWFFSQGSLGYSDFVWFEIVQGSTSKPELAKAYRLFKHMTRVNFHFDDIQWTRNYLPTFALSHGIGILDTLIAASASRLKLPLYTQNIKHFAPILGKLAVRPYIYPAL